MFTRSPMNLMFPIPIEINMRASRLDEHLTNN